MAERQDNHFQGSISSSGGNNLYAPNFHVNGSVNIGSQSSSQSAPFLDEVLFVGREDDLSFLEKVLVPSSEDHIQRIAIISGLGGIGKTQLAIAFARQTEDKFSTTIWLDAKNEATLRQSISTFVIQLKGQPVKSDSSNRGLEEQHILDFQAWLSAAENSKWLLIFDNHDNPRIDAKCDGDAYDIKRYFPHRAQGSMLITTRSRRLQYGKTLRLNTLDEHHSKQVLLLRSELDTTTADDGLSELVKRLQGLPLALSTAGDYLRQTGIDFGEYLQYYDQAWQDLADDATELPDYKDRTLYTTWGLSLDILRGRHPEACQLLRFLAYFDNEDIWFELLHAGAQRDPRLASVLGSKIKFNAAMSKLHEFSLVDVSESKSSWSMHACVHDWNIHHVNADIDQELFWTALHCVAEGYVWEVTRVSWQQNRRLFQHALRFQSDRSRRMLFKDGDYRDHYNFSGIGSLYLDQGKFDEAEVMYKHVLAVCEKALGPGHVLTLATMHNLGITYREQGKLSEAEEIYIRALEGKEKALGLEYTSTLDTIYNLGNLYIIQGKLSEAEEMFMRALAGYDKALGLEYTSTLDTVHGLGHLYYKQGKLSEAEAMYKRALEGKEKALGLAHKDTLDIVYNLGCLYATQNRLTAAREMYSRALSGYTVLYGRSHKETLDAEAVLARIEAKLDEFEI